MFRKLFKNNSISELRKIQKQIEEMENKEPQIPPHWFDGTRLKSYKTIEKFSDSLEEVLLGNMNPQILLTYYSYEIIKEIGMFLINLEDFYEETSNWKSKLSELRKREYKIKRELGIK